MSLPFAFAEHTLASVTIGFGTSVPGCEEKNVCYTPYEVTIDVGSEVTWANKDSAAHTVTAGSGADGPSGAFDSGLFMSGATFSHKFEEVGTYNYFCMVHPWMVGVVIVEKNGNSQNESVGIEKLSSDGTIKIRLQMSQPIAGEMLEMNLEFFDAKRITYTEYPDEFAKEVYLEHINYDVKAIQNGEIVLDDRSAHHHDGKGTHYTAPLYSDDSLDFLSITLQGVGIDDPLKGPKNEEIIFVDTRTESDSENGGSSLPPQCTLPEPVRLSPLSGTTTENKRPTFGWKVDHTCPDMIFNFQWSTDPSFDGNVASIISEHKKPSFTFTPSNNLPLGDIYWRVTSMTTDIRDSDFKTSKVMKLTIKSHPVRPNLEPIMGMPYKITLNSDDTALNNVRYEVMFDFKEDFFITHLDKGDFSNIYKNSDSSVVFEIDNVPPNQQKSGIVAFSFTEDSPLHEQKSDVTITVTANGQTNTITKDPLGILEIITQVLDTVEQGFELAVDIYEYTTPCFDLKVDYDDDNPLDQTAKYSVQMENCAEHRQKINLKIDQTRNPVFYQLNPKDPDVPADTTDTSSLTFFIPDGMADGTYPFDVTGYVILDVFGQKWNMTSTSGSEFFVVKKPHVTPEFPLTVMMIIVMIIVMTGLIAYSKTSSYKKLNL